MIRLGYFKHGRVDSNLRLSRYSSSGRTAIRPSRHKDLSNLFDQSERPSRTPTTELNIYFKKLQFNYSFKLNYQTF